MSSISTIVWPDVSGLKLPRPSSKLIMNSKTTFSPAAERNREAILDALRQTLTPDEHVFEIASGTGQHARLISSAMPGILWQPSDVAEKLAGIRQWITDEGSPNLLQPVEFNPADCDDYPYTATACYAANTLHVINWQQVQNLFKAAARILKNGGPLCVYGPFMIDRKHTSEGNRQFDQQLKAEDRMTGIRDVADLDKLASNQGFSEIKIIDMPSNNKVLVWNR